MSNYVTTGNFRATVLRVTKTIGGVAADGYPKDYSILGAFGTYSIITEDAFRKLSDASYNGRLTAFYDYIEEEEGRSYFPTSGNTGTGECEAGKPTIMYGLLYNWGAVNSGILIPAGWRLPTHLEWTALVADVDGGDAMSVRHAPTYNHPRWDYETVQTDTLDLAVLPAGSRSSTGTYNSFGEEAVFWAEKDGSDYKLCRFRLTDVSLTPKIISSSASSTFFKFGASIRFISETVGTLANGDFGTLTDESDNIYTTKRIDIDLGAGDVERVWMCENFKSTKYTDSTNIMDVNSNSIWTLPLPGYCAPNGDSSNI